ncbi:MAG: hypothetical protein AAF462_09545 [Thermodesulfobacteriota bacterium]
MHRVINLTAIFFILTFIVCFSSDMTHSSEDKIMDSIMSELPGFEELKKYHPDVYQEILVQIQEYAKSGDEDTIKSIVQAQVMAMFAKDVLKAPPEAIVEYLNSTNKLIDYASERDPKCCDSFLRGDTRCFEQILSFAEMKEYLTMMGNVIRLAHTKTSTQKLDEEKATADIVKISTSDELPVGDNCKLSIYIFESFAELPPDRMSNAFKYMIQSVAPQ